MAPVHRSRPIAQPADPSPSPRSWKKLEHDRRVGLAIVAALESTSAETPPPSVFVSASSPISITSPRPGRRRASPEAPESRELGGFRVADFLSYCLLCRKRLHGKDIYMYRGEKAFCSIECRCQQIISDEYQDICGAEAARPAAEAPSSPYSGGGGRRRIFFPGIVVS